MSDAEHLLLANATVPVSLVEGVTLDANPEGLAVVDIAIAKGRILSIKPANPRREEGPADLDLDRGMALPLFVDMHTHLDKGHIWPRRPNPDGRFMSALEAVRDDRIQSWSAEDIRRRMDFSLRTAFAHGTRVIRTHIDSIPPQETISWPVFAEMRSQWAGRIELQAVSLVGPDTALDIEALRGIAPVVKAHGGIFGVAVADYPGADRAIQNIVQVAAEFGLDVDAHVDETNSPDALALRHLAEAVIAQKFAGSVVAGHCCSLATQAPDVADRTMDLVAKAGISVVSLPMCNMYLQDRQMPGDPARTPRWRGVTLLHEMKARGIKVAVASDNTRDPFYAYGDLDALEVLRESVRILHLDHPLGDWPAAITRTPADILGLPQHGRIAVGAAADLTLYRARSFNELFSRPQFDRVVLRDGLPTEADLPDYRELDDLLGEM